MNNLWILCFLFSCFNNWKKANPNNTATVKSTFQHWKLFRMPQIENLWTKSITHNATNPWDNEKFKDFWRKNIKPIIRESQHKKLKSWTKMFKRGFKNYMRKCLPSSKIMKDHPRNQLKAFLNRNNFQCPSKKPMMWMWWIWTSKMLSLSLFPWNLPSMISHLRESIQNWLQKKILKPILH